MALVLAFEDAKKNQIKGKGDGKNTTGGFTQTPFFGSRDHPELPHANLNKRDPGRTSRPHFHLNDQFQVVVEGKGKLGRHDCTPYCVHFSRAYTPYGPLSSDTASPLAQFVLRPRYDPGSQRLPKELDKLKQVPDRRPWQITRQVEFPALQSGTSVADVMLRPIPDIKDEQGLAAYTLRMKPNTESLAPDPSQGDGQYLVLVKGSLLHDNKEHQALGLVFVYPKEAPFKVRAGPEGLEALVLNFPSRESRGTRTTSSVHRVSGFKTWQCALCEFVYREAAGLPEEGIAPGTSWQEVPESWSCPDCGASKTDFQMMEL